MKEKLNRLNALAARQAGKVGASAVLAVGTASAFAQEATTFDATSYAASITALVAGVLVVGGAVFGLNVAIKSTKWARRAL